MKRFALALALCTLLAVVPATMAGALITWNGANGVNNWAAAAPSNWNVAAYPGVLVGDDLALINAPAAGNPALFGAGDGNAGAYTMGVSGTRFVHHIRVADTNGAMGLTINSGATAESLSTRQLDLYATVSAAVTLTVTSGVFDVKFMDIQGTAAAVTIIADVNYSVSNKTTIAGVANCSPSTAGVVVDFGYLVMENGSSLSNTGAGVCQSS